MKRNLLLLFLLLGATTVFGQSYITLWNGTNKYQIKQVNPSNGSLTNIGLTSAMTSYYDLDDIYYDATNNQLVGLYQGTDLWKYNLTTNTDQIVDLGTATFRTMIVTPTNSYLLAWNSTNSNYEIKQINLVTNTITHLGVTTHINGNTDLNEVYYDASNNKLTGIHWGTDLWQYDLTTNTDAILNITGSDYYRSLTIANQKAYLIRWNTNKYEVYSLNTSDGSITLLGSSTTVSSLYDINEVYYDADNSQIIGLHQYTGLWRYSLISNTDQITGLGTDQYRDLAIYSTGVTTGVISPMNEGDDEVVKIYDMMGREYSVIEADKVLILLYKSGKTKKILVTE